MTHGFATQLAKGIFLDAQGKEYISEAVPQLFLTGDLQTHSRDTWGMTLVGMVMVEGEEVISRGTLA